MKLLFAFSCLMLLGIIADAQDSLDAGVYKLNGKWKGSTTDLAVLHTHISILQPGKINHPPRALKDAEEIIIVKEGTLKVIINDSAKTLSAGSIILIQANDKQHFENTSDAPVTYYVLSFKSKLPLDLNRGRAAGGSLMKDWNSLTIKKTVRGESRPIFDRPSAMFSRFEIHSTALNSGEASHAPHTHRAEEIMLLVQGNITAKIAGKEYPVSPGELILVTPDILHNVTNTGTGQCLYYAIKWFN